MAKELLAQVVEEYVGLDEAVGELVVCVGVVNEDKWHAYALLSKPIKKPRFSKIMKKMHQALKCHEVSTVKPYAHTQLFQLPVEQE